MGHDPPMRRNSFHDCVVLWGQNKSVKRSEKGRGKSGKPAK
jgi:hypothetical protein